MAKVEMKNIPGVAKDYFHHFISEAIVILLNFK